MRVAMQPSQVGGPMQGNPSAQGRSARHRRQTRIGRSVPLPWPPVRPI
eukprot:CAMPEP_0170195136 /NCGR_PEP_ID=MMETSP0040_2-20121228/60839_1 /TAXON_ID=641309 /ORGANISM="Lotharella oceanica, Strain CCMP622" /LENGTH=47 /DNA_ID= /DNA_START= /DNA_END= /DNA_ORIENTATION=